MVKNKQVFLKFEGTNDYGLSLASLASKSLLYPTESLETILVIRASECVQKGRSFRGHKLRLVAATRWLIVAAAGCVIGQDGATRRWNIRVGRRFCIQYGNFFSFAFLLGFNDRNILPGLIKRIANFGLLLFHRQTRVQFQLFHQVINFNAKLLFASLDFTLQ